LIGGFLPEDPLRFDEVTKDLSAAVFVEELIGCVGEHGAVEDLDSDAVATASVAPRATERAAVVVAVRPSRSAGCRLELVPASSALRRASLVLDELHAANVEVAQALAPLPLRDNAGDD
jgi:hypothetical protein